ncbi:MAG: sugar ABC transporter ATP-binding protein [Synergistaceae bacterium]|jgi:simple sugar transport system ATP-binding protein|nr:sugar ABC transporter ATP-binding protein [Synergistaceae bacterium]
MTGADAPLLRLEGIGKEYFGNVVLTDVSFTLGRGEIIGLVGENGAGKSTLMNILFGMPVIHSTGGYRGGFYIDGRLAKFANPFDALDAGIGMVHQEFSLIPGFSAAENVVLNRESLDWNRLVELFGPRFSTLDRARIADRAASAIGKLGVEIGTDTLVSEMSVGHKQFIEIAREIDRENTRILVFDEPTAVLTESEAVVLMGAIRRLADSGIGVIFISHRLKEVLSLCDRVVVLRDGRVVKEVPAADTDVRRIAGWMMDRSVEETGAAPVRKTRELSDETVLHVGHLWVDMPGEFAGDISFDVSRGEIFGIGGLAGQGKLAVANGIMGMYPAGGDVWFDGRPVPLGDTRAVLSMGMAFVSEERRGVGLLLEEGIDLNIAFSAMLTKGMFLKKFLGGLIGIQDREAMRRAALEYVRSLDIKCVDPSQRVVELSGGNQQKVCLARAFVTDPKLLFVAEPTRGVDVGAKQLVLETLRRVNEEQMVTVVMISSEIEELRSICDRIAVVDEGVVSGILPASSSADEFGVLMAGGAALREEALG